MTLDQIEYDVARGAMKAPDCFTQMLQHVRALEKRNAETEAKFADADRYCTALLQHIEGLGVELGKVKSQVFGRDSRVDPTATAPIEQGRKPSSMDHGNADEFTLSEPSSVKGRKCSYCGGNGLIQVIQTSEHCSWCGSELKHEDDAVCPECKGTGRACHEVATPGTEKKGERE